MKQIENDVNDYIKNYDFNVLYKVTMKYRNTDQIPIGILIEAQSIDGDFSICKFCYNIEKYIKFDYSDGNIIYNHNYLKKVKEKFNNLKINIISQSNKNKKQKKTVETKINYILNINAKECHYSKDCEKLENIEPKYIQGTRTTRKVILDSGFKMCNKCKNVKQ